jgi:hypothetical protein
MHEVRPGRRLYLTYDLKRAPGHVSKVHDTLIAQRHGNQLAPLRPCGCDRPLLCGGWPASSSGRLPPGPWSRADLDCGVLASPDRAALTSESPAPADDAVLSLSSS